MPDEAISPGIFRYALRLEYRGSAYRGWQYQKGRDCKTVQGFLQKAVSSVANEEISLVCAGRTDAGVHATAQVVHFDTRAVRPERAWVNGVNTLLPDDIRVHWAALLDQGFHARFSATARRYQYLILNSPVRSAIANGLLTHEPHSLDVQAMHAAAQALLGENDFSSFRASGCQSLSPNRCVSALSVSRRQNLVIVDIKANAFLHHMVRNITGSLLEVGRGKRKPEWMGELLSARDRTAAGKTAPPDGLYLVQVDYPDSFGIPQDLIFPPVLS